MRAAKAAVSAGVRAMPEFICASLDSLSLRRSRKLRVLGWVLEIFPQLGRRGRIGRVPDQRLAQCGLRVGIVGVLLQNPDALGARARIVGEHDAQGDDETGIAGIALGQGAHAGESVRLAVGRGVEGFVVGQGYVAVGRMVAVELR